MDLFSGSLSNLYNLFKSNKVGLDNEIEHSILSKAIAKFLFLFSNLLQSSNGRDKLCALIQYLAKFYSACILYTIDIENNIDTDFLYNKFDASKRIEKSMSSGRKIFRFLKFMEDLKKLYSYIYKTPDAVQVLKAMLCLSSFFYHIMDNLVWAANTGIIDEFLLGEIKWKLSKNFFSYIRNWIKITMDCIKLRKYISYDRYNEEEILNTFNKEMSKFKVQSDYNIIAHALKNRAKIRMKSINIMHSALRIYMLSYNLKIDPLYRLTHPIFIGFLGVIHASISIYKNLSKSDFTNTYSIYGFSERNVSSLEKLLIDEKSDYYYILEEDYFDNYYIDFNKDFQILLINIDSI